MHIENEKDEPKIEQINSTQEIKKPAVTYEE